MGLVTSCTCTQEDKYRFKHYVVAVYPRSREAQIVNKDAVDKLQSYIASNPERIPRVCRKVNKLVRTQLQSKEVERVLLSVTLLRALIEHASVIDGFVPGVLDLCERLVQEDEKRRNEDTVRYCVGAASLVTALCIRLTQKQQEQELPSVQYASARRLLANSKQRLLPTFVLMGTDMAATRNSASDEAALERLVSDGAAAVRAARLRCRYAALVVIAHLLHTVPESMASDVMDLLPCILHCLVFYNRALIHIAQRANNNNSNGNGNNSLHSARLVHGGMNASSAAQRWRDVLDHPPTGTEIEDSTQATTNNSSSRGGESSQQQVNMSMVMQYGIQACTYALYGAAQAVPTSEARAFVKQILTFSLDQRQMRTSGNLPVMVLAAITNALEQRSQPCGWLVFESLMDIVMRHCLSITTASSSFAGVTAASTNVNARPAMPLNQYARTLAMKVHYLDRLPRSEKMTLLNLLHSLRVVLAEVNLCGSRGEDVMQRLLSLTVWRPTQRDTSAEEEEDEPALDDRNNEGAEEAEALRESREALGEDNVANNDDDGVVALAEDVARENNTNNGSFVTAVDKEVVCEAVAELWQALLSHRTINTTPLRYAAISSLLTQLTQCQARTTAMSPAVHDMNITQLLHCMVRVAPFVRLWPEAERTLRDNSSLLLVPTIKPFLYSRDETVWRVMALRVLRGLLVGQPVLCNACDMSPSATTTAECNAALSEKATTSSVVNATRRRDKSRPLIEASHMTSSANNTNNNSSEAAAQGTAPALYTSEADIQATRRWLLWWCVQTCEAIKQGGREGIQQTQLQRKRHTSGSERSLPTLVVVPFCQTPACVREVGELMAALLYTEGTSGLPFVLQLLCLLQRRCIAAAMHHTQLGSKATSAHHHRTVKDGQENDEEEESNSTSSTSSSSSASEADDEKKEGEVVQACTPLMQAVLHMSLAVLISAGRQLRLRTLTNYAEELLRRRRGRQLARCFLSGLVMSRHTSSLMQPHYVVSTGLTIALGSSNPTVTSTVASASGMNEDSSNGPSAEAQQQQQQLLLQDTLTPASQLLSSVTWLPESRITQLPSFTTIAQLLSNSPKEDEGKVVVKTHTMSTAAALSRLDWPSFFTHDALTALLQESETNDALPVSDAGDTAHVVNDNKEVEHKKEEDVRVDEATQQEANASLAERLGLQRSADWPAIANIHLQLVNNTTFGLTQAFTTNTKSQTTSALLTLTSATTTSNSKSVDAVLGTSNTTTAATRIAELLTRYHVTASTNLAESYPLHNANTATAGHQAAMTSSTTQTDQAEVQIPPQQKSPATDTNLPIIRSPHANDLHDTTTTATAAATAAHHDTNNSTMTTTEPHETVTLRKLDVSTTRNGTQANTVQGTSVRPDMHRIGGEEMTTSPLH